jgi:REP element-mobilizing transposase RayT
MGTRRRPSRIDPQGHWLFLTWPFHGSLPRVLYPPRQPSAAEAILEILRRGAKLGDYQLGAYVVMPDRVDLLLLPFISPSRLLKALRGHTARQANRLLGRTGRPFWQPESGHRWVRDERERQRIAAGIESQPVQAGLAAQAEDYPWSSASGRARAPDTTPSFDTPSPAPLY